jgi:hypothetical protein
MPRKRRGEVDVKKTRTTSSDRLLKQLDEQVELRRKAVLSELDASDKIAKLVYELKQQHGVPMAVLTQHVRRVSRSDRRLKPVTRQTIDTMLTKVEGGRPSKERRLPPIRTDLTIDEMLVRIDASRRRKTADGDLNVAALEQSGTRKGAT